MKTPTQLIGQYIAAYKIVQGAMEAIEAGDASVQANRDLWLATKAMLRALNAALKGGVSVAKLDQAKAYYNELTAVLIDYRSDLLRCWREGDLYEASDYHGRMNTDWSLSIDKYDATRERAISLGIKESELKAIVAEELERVTREDIANA